MKRIFSCIISLLCVANVFSQNTVYLADIDSSLAKDASYFDCFYNVYADSLFLGSVYAITYYNQEQNNVTLCLTDNSEIPGFVLYKFPLNANAKISVDDYDISVCDVDLTYDVSYDREYFYITFDFMLGGKHFIYAGKTEVLDDPD